MTEPIHLMLHSGLRAVSTLDMQTSRGWRGKAGLGSDRMSCFWGEDVCFWGTKDAEPKKQGECSVLGILLLDAVSDKGKL